MATDPLPSLNFYLTLSTALILVLNAILLYTLRLAVGWAKLATAALSEEERPASWKRANRQLIVLILSVIAINAAAVFTHHHLRQSVTQLQILPE